MMLLYISMVRSSYIIILSGVEVDRPQSLFNSHLKKSEFHSQAGLASVGDDVPILGALMTLFDGKGILLFLMMLLYISLVRSSYIIILSAMGDDVPILGAVVTLFDGKGALLYC